MRRMVESALFGVVLVLGGGIAIPSSALAKAPPPQADYRFNLNLKSSVNKANAPTMKEIGGGFSYYFTSIGGQRDNYLNWVSGSGLKLPQAQKVIGTPGDYTIAMLANFDEVDTYRKIVDFDNDQADEGWYVHDSYLDPFDVDDVSGPASPPITGGAWHMLVMTRAGGRVKAYVDNVRYLNLPDPTGEEVLGPQRVLRFLRDNGLGSEETGGKIARLRIWKNPLTDKQAKNLKPLFN